MKFTISNSNRNQEDDIIKKMNDLKGLKHKNIIPYIDYYLFIDPKQEKMECNLIMEYADGIIEHTYISLGLDT